MIKAIIIDDEQHCIDRLEGLIKSQHNRLVNLMSAFLAVKEGIKAIRDLNPGLIFLDIQIHDRTSFDLLRGMRKN